MSEVLKKSHPKSFMMAVDFDSSVGRELMHSDPKIDFNMYWEDHDEKAEDPKKGYEEDYREVVVLQAAASGRLLLVEVVEKKNYDGSPVR